MTPPCLAKIVKSQSACMRFECKNLCLITAYDCNMPREQVRKRGRRKTKTDEDYVRPKPALHREELSTEAGPSSGPSFHPARAALIAGHRPPPPAEIDDQPLDSQTEEQGNPNFPFGELDPDLKAYFRTVEDQIKDWEGVSSVGEEREGEEALSGVSRCL